MLDVLLSGRDEVDKRKMFIVHPMCGVQSPNIRPRYLSDGRHNRIPWICVLRHFSPISGHWTMGERPKDIVGIKKRQGGERRGQLERNCSLRLLCILLPSEDRIATDRSVKIDIMSKHLDGEVSNAISVPFEEPSMYDLDKTVEM